jgi:hypothetical protein
MTLSDLDFVNEAVAAESARHTPIPSSTPDPSSAPSAPSSGPVSAPAPVSSAPAPDPLADIDLTSLSPADRAALQPILDALRASATTGDGDAELDIGSILAQLDAAGEAADVLEGRLDALLAHLGEMEVQAGDK